jgi:hypothetical protein
MLATTDELRDEIIAHPWTMVAFAFALGAYVAFDRTHAAQRAVMSSLGTTLLGTMHDAIERRMPFTSSYRPSRPSGYSP